MMTLDQLRIFVAVAEFEHVTRAAERLGLTQSATSAAIAALERQYATPLFHRVGRRIQLTEAGRIFLAEAKVVVARAVGAELILQELSEMRRGTLVVQASQTIASYWLPRHLVRFRQLYPMIQIRLGIDNTAQVAKAVLDGVVDLGFIEGDVDDAALAHETIAHDRLALVVGAAHPWAGRSRVDPCEFATTTWVLREPGSGTRSTFEATLAGFGIRAEALNIAIELPSNEAVRMAVEAGIGATAISELVVADGIERGVLHRIEFDVPERPFQTLRHRERYLSRASTALLELIRESKRGPH